MTDHRAQSCPPDERLSAWLDGDLDPQQALAVDVHLAHCAHCQAVRDELTGLRDGLRGLAVVAAPPTWEQRPGASTTPAVRAPRVVSRRRWALGGLGAVGIAAAAALLLYILPPTTTTQATATATPDAAASARAHDALASVRQAEQQYIDAIGKLEQAVTQDTQRYRPEVRAVIERGLATIDETVRQSQRAMRETPEDLAAHELMLATYQQKVDFLSGFANE
ncbi:MAG: zf-HC2 domain-containing protein [Pseudomonadota bacterium]